jgi:hypothetical protein
MQQTACRELLLFTSRDAKGDVLKFFKKGITSEEEKEAHDARLAAQVDQYAAEFEERMLLLLKNSKGLAGR